MRRLRRWTTVGAAGMALAVLGGACAGSSPAAGAGPAPAAGRSNRSAGPSAGPVLVWGHCTPALPSDYQCATLRVPLDPAHPVAGGPTIGLALDRHRATGTRIASLLVNPGGPGVSGVAALPGIVSELTPNLLDHFDVVGFDPPGVGGSDPVICASGRQLDRYLHLDPAPATPSGLAALVAGDRSFAAGCQARSGRVLPYVSTAAAARDMDRIRQALGDAKLTYLGFSYGTLLGATYAGFYPHRVRAMVLDGAVDPTLSPLTDIEAQSRAIDGQLRSLETSCSSSASCPWRAPRGQNLASSLTALLHRVRAHPLRAAGTSRTVGPAEVLYGTAAGLYSTTTWPRLEQALAQAEGGDGTGLLALFDAYVGRAPDGSYANTVEAESAVNCLDAPAPSLAQIATAASQIARSAPVFGPLDVDSEITCTVWPVSPTRVPHAIAAVGSPPIVVVGSTGDPVTPYVWAEHLASQLQHGVLLTRVGDGHTGYGASSCIRDAVGKYLVDLVPPSPGLRCPSG